MRKKTTHIRVERDILGKARKEMPEYSCNEIFKVGYSTIRGINMAGKFMYGDMWKGKDGKKTKRK